jgi:hypothetical protein
MRVFAAPPVPVALCLSVNRAHKRVNTHLGAALPAEDVPFPALLAAGMLLAAGATDADPDEEADTDRDADLLADVDVLLVLPAVPFAMKSVIELSESVIWSLGFASVRVCIAAGSSPAWKKRSASGIFQYVLPLYAVFCPSSSCMCIRQGYAKWEKNKAEARTMVYTQSPQSTSPLTEMPTAPVKFIDTLAPFEDVCMKGWVTVAFGIPGADTDFHVPLYTRRASVLS